MTGPSFLFIWRTCTKYLLVESNDHHPAVTKADRGVAVTETDRDLTLFFQLLIKKTVWAVWEIPQFFIFIWHACIR